MNIQTKTQTNLYKSQNAQPRASEKAATTAAPDDSFSPAATGPTDFPKAADIKAFFEPPKARDLKMSRLPDIPDPARSSFGVARSGSLAAGGADTLLVRLRWRLRS